LASEGAAVASDGSRAEAPATGNRPVSILIVEDEALIASYIEEVLASSGYSVSGIAASGAEALSLAAEHHPSLALVDIRLNGPIDGIDLACQLRGAFDVPTIFLSGQVDPRVVERARAARPLGFLTKPFLPSQVFNTIERAIDLLSR
jgi:CheY-like chemotaxis protein